MHPAWVGCILTQKPAYPRSDSNRSRRFPPERGQREDQRGLPPHILLQRSSGWRREQHSVQQAAACTCSYQNFATCNPHRGSARAGDYRLSVANAKTKERLPGSPYALAVRAAAADAARSSAAFIDGAKPVMVGTAGAAAAAEAAAGVPVTLAVTLRDRFGNLAPGAPVTGQRGNAVLKLVKQTLQHPSLFLKFCFCN